MECIRYTVHDYMSLKKKKDEQSVGGVWSSRERERGGREVRKKRKRIWNFNLAESNRVEMSKKKQMDREGGSTTEAMTDYMDFKGRKMDMKSIMKDIEFLGSSHMTWKQRKDLENRKVVALGGKPPKNQRLPLSVARVTMKKQKERDQKLQEERLALGRFGGMLGGGSKRVAKKRRPEDSVLKSTEGYFKNGVLNVKNLLKPAGTAELDRSINTLSAGFDNPGKKKGGSKKKGKKKGGGKKRH